MNFEARSRRSAAGLIPIRVTGLYAATLAIVATLALFCAPVRAASVEHVFNAKLSLTGDCTTSATDSRPDPGCPGGVHPPKPFAKVGGVTVDRFGNRYVASAGGSLSGTEGRIDVFNPKGVFITEISPVLLRSYRAILAVDSKGNLYVAAGEPFAPPNLVRYTPTKYNPAAGEIAYDPTPVVVPRPFGNGRWSFNHGLGIAIDPTTDHLLVVAVFDEPAPGIMELNSASEGNDFVRLIRFPGKTIGPAWLFVNALALDATRHRLYFADYDHEPTAVNPAIPVVKAFNLDAPADPELPREQLFTLDGSTTPTNRFVSEPRVLPVAVDEATGNVFVGDLEAPTRRVYEFDPTGAPLATIEGPIRATSSGVLQLGYDNGPTSPTKGYLFVPSDSAPARSLAFGPPPPVAPPVVSGLSVSGVTSSDAILAGSVNAKGLDTTWRIEYVTEAEFLTDEFDEAELAGEGLLEPEDDNVLVSAAVGGLLPGTPYRFRVVAENEEGLREADYSFSTYAKPEISSDCPNQDLRTGQAVYLPDCRMYELVTPTDTNGRTPFARGVTVGFLSRLASPDGNAVSFKVEGGVLPGMEGTGSLSGDPYLSRRGQSGWETEATGPNGSFSSDIVSGSSSSDQGHLAWLSNQFGPAALEGKKTYYVRYPDGHSEPVGQGSLATDPGAQISLIAEHGAHVIFSTGGADSTMRQLEPSAPPNGTGAIYDRTADGTVHVVSLLPPPADPTPKAGENALFMGASLDGEGVAFEIKNTLYLRHDNEATFEIAKGVRFTGVAEGGERVFYVEGDDLYRFDAEDESTMPFSESGDVTVVNVASNGTAIYFVSPSVLDPGPNPAGDTPQAGQENLWLSREGQVSFVGTVSERDVEGKKFGAETIRGLGSWARSTLGADASLQWTSLARDPSRSTADGSVLLFESNAQLTEHDPEGHTQIYRYDAQEGTLRCLSCNPTGASGGDATLQALESEAGSLSFAGPLSSVNVVNNLSSDGKRAFFESTEALVVSDVDGLRDVYEWEEEGAGSCETPNGCLYLITAGNSGRNDYLWAASDSGDDVFVYSNDLLAPAFDYDETASIYDARVGGGFAPSQALSGECLGEACQPAAEAPNDLTPASSTFQGAGNVKEEEARGRQSCPKGRRAVRKGGKRRCVVRKSKPRSGKSQKGKANGKRRAGR